MSFLRRRISREAATDLIVNHCYKHGYDKCHVCGGNDIYGNYLHEKIEVICRNCGYLVTFYLEIP